MHLRTEQSGSRRHAPTARPIKALRLAAVLAVGLTGFLLSGTSAWGAGRGQSLPPGSWIIHGRSPSTKTVNGTTTSHNWSGYAVTGTTFTQVEGSWVEPTAQCPTPTKKTQAAAFWVGIDGFSSKDDTVEQIGADSDCDKGPKKGPGIQNYYAWWEMDTATSTGSTTIPEPVSPGDEMSAVVTNDAGTDTLTRVDAGPTGQGKWTYSPGPQTPSPAPKAASAEWIAEAPSICTAKKCTPENLADFGSVTFTGATANGSSVSSFPNNQTFKINMTKGKTIKAEPVGLSGSQFSIDWEHS
jgi:hypothetical protein